MSAAARKPTPRRRPGEASTLTPKVEHLVVGDTSPPEPPPAAESRTPEPPDSGSPRARSGSEGQPRYRQQLRMEARLWPEQLPALDALRRQVNAARTVRGERITDNTLLRIAVDLLLAHADQLQGNNEEELRKSVVPDSGSARQRK